MIVNNEVAHFHTELGAFIGGGKRDSILLIASIFSLRLCHPVKVKEEVGMENCRSQGNTWLEEVVFLCNLEMAILWKQTVLSPWRTLPWCVMQLQTL